MNAVGSLIEPGAMLAPATKRLFRQMGGAAGDMRFRDDWEARARREKAARLACDDEAGHL